jgi:hypothetical protein
MGFWIDERQALGRDLSVSHLGQTNRAGAPSRLIGSLEVNRDEVALRRVGQAGGLRRMPPKVI